MLPAGASQLHKRGSERKGRRTVRVLGGSRAGRGRGMRGGQQSGCQRKMMVAFSKGTEEEGTGVDEFWENEL